MSITLLVPGALVPAPLAAELAGATDAPWLAARLRRAAPPQPSMGDAERWIARSLFDAAADDPPTAPYAWAELGGAADPDAWFWHAEPAHIAVGRDSLVLQAIDAPLAPDEARALMAAANDTLAAAGARLLGAGEAWFLRTESAWTLEQAPYQRALGGALPAGVPQAADARRWARLHNEIQMRWHDAPANAAREARGRAAVNGLWLHGGGRWAAQPALRWRAVHSDRPGLRGLARARGAAAAGAGAPPADNTLVVWDGAQSAAREGDWRAWTAAVAALDAQLAAWPEATLELVLTGGGTMRTWTLRPGDRWALWRRAPLAQALAA